MHPYNAIQTVSLSWYCMACPVRTWNTLLNHTRHNVILAGTFPSPFSKSMQGIIIVIIIIILACWDKPRIIIISFHLVFHYTYPSSPPSDCRRLRFSLLADIVRLINSILVLLLTYYYYYYYYFLFFIFF